MGIEKYPIGFWNYVAAEKQGPEAVNDWSECGMTLAMGPEYTTGNARATENMHGIMKEAETKGIRLIHCHQDTTWRSMNSLSSDEYRRRAEAAFTEFGGYDSLLGFHVGDEPDLFMKTDYPDVVSSFRVLNDIAPQHNHFSNFLPWWLGIEQEIYCPENTYEEHLENMELTHIGSWHAGKSFGGWPNLTGDEFVQIILADTPFVYSLFVDSAGLPYILIMNNSPEKAVQAYFRLGKDVQSLDRIAWEGAVEEELIDHRYEEFSEFSKWFMPAQLELYRVVVTK